MGRMDMSQVLPPPRLESACADSARRAGHCQPALFLRCFCTTEICDEPDTKKSGASGRDWNSQTAVSKTGCYSNSHTLTLVHRGGFEPPRPTRWPVHFRSGSCTCARSVSTDTES